MRILDALVLRAHRLRFFGRSLSPYLFMVDAGLVAVVLFVAWFCRAHVALGAVPFATTFVSTYAAYELVFLPLKRRLVRGASRSYLQDTAIFVLPAWVVAARVWGLPLRPSFDLLGLCFPLFLGFVRVGCFLAGCCYGVRAAWGVLYPREIFETTHHGCRRFRPGDDPRGRVLPVQLFEATAQLAIWGVLLARITAGAPLTGATLPMYFATYAALRFVSDFARASSARPRVGPLSEAQVVSVGVLVVSCAVLLRF